MFKDMVEYGIYYVDRYEICFDCMVGASLLVDTHSTQLYQHNKNR